MKPANPPPAADLPETIKVLREKLREATGANEWHLIDLLISACRSVSEGAIRETFEAGWEKGYERGPDPYTDYSSLPGDIAAYLSSRQKGSTPV